MGFRRACTHVDRAAHSPRRLGACEQGKVSIMRCSLHVPSGGCVTRTRLSQVKRPITHQGGAIKRLVQSNCQIKVGDGGVHVGVEPRLAASLRAKTILSCRLQYCRLRMPGFFRVARPPGSALTEERLLASPPTGNGLLYRCVAWLCLGRLAPVKPAAPLTRRCPRRPIIAEKTRDLLAPRQVWRSCASWFCAR